MFRWGILGTAQIAKKNWKAIRNSGNGIITALASRDAERAQRFMADCQTEAPMEITPKALSRYEDLLASDEVDGVYIPLPTGIRKDWVIRAAEAGKHVVCEKPCGNTLVDVEEMIEACRRSGVQFMDGVMFVHSRRLERIREALHDSRSVGHIRRINSAFSFCAPDEFFSGNIRADSGLEPHGCVGDLGWYCIRFALWVMNWNLPKHATGRMLSHFGSKDSPMSAPTEFSAELVFDGGVSAGFYCSFITAHQQWVNISGTKGYLRVPDFVLPFFGTELAFETQNAVFNIRGCDFNMESHLRRHPVDEYSNSHPNAQESNLFRDFVNQVRSGALHELWPEMALKTQQVMHGVLESARAGGRVVEFR